MQILRLDVLLMAGGIVDIPIPVEEVDLGGPDVAAPTGLRVRVYDLLLGRLETLDCGRPRDPQVAP